LARWNVSDFAEGASALARLARRGEQRRMRRRVEESRLSGRKPVPPQTIGKAENLNEQQRTIRLATEATFSGAEPKLRKKTRRKHRIPRTKRRFSCSTAKRKKLPRKNRRAEDCKGQSEYKLPSPTLLREGERSHKLDEAELKERARAIEEKCLEFDIQGRVTQINPGPVVTTFEFKPEAGIKYTRITGLTEDLCLALQAESILIERILGNRRSASRFQTSTGRPSPCGILEAPEFMNSPSKLTLAMGRDLHGRIRITDLSAMPHLLIAGSTGTGKSVFIQLADDVDFV